jgi:hypothetical protein
LDLNRQWDEYALYGFYVSPGFTPTYIIYITYSFDRSGLTTYIGDFYIGRFDNVTSVYPESSGTYCRIHNVNHLPHDANQTLVFSRRGSNNEITRLAYWIFGQ